MFAQTRERNVPMRGNPIQTRTHLIELLRLDVPGLFAPDAAATHEASCSPTAQMLLGCVSC